MSELRRTFPRSHRLSGRAAFSSVFGAKARKSSGPLTLLTRPNDLPHNRLGLSIGRRVGSAVKRNRIKRLIREAFRLTQHALPQGYDLVVVVHPHDLLPLESYQRHLGAALAQGDALWRKRSARRG